VISIPIRGVILDVDGTLVDSNDQHAWAWQEALLEAGFDCDHNRVRSLVGMGSDNLLPELSGLEQNSPQSQRISRRHDEIFKTKYLRKLHAFPKVRELLLRMRQEGLKLAVGTSAKSGELDALLKIARIEDLIETQSSADDAANSKPDPDILCQALKKLDLGPEEVLMLGDTPYDVEAAQRAGLRTIALRCGGWEEPELQGALEVYQDAADLLANFQTSAFCRAVAVPARDEASF
jgi:HAD superfamily hydrolase (TIGR01509 family)